ncbi:MAG: DUF2007 domain-containing protein [Alistipes sp.]|nr:DUF2007 domain-containing protein [Alistipes sp.]MBO7306815.1 DUF2007 domain-containing protein [Alistipes sp.]
MTTTTTPSESLVLVQAFDNPMQAEISKSILDCAGIFCVLHGEYLSSIYSIGAFPTRLMVRPEDLEEARKLLGER